MKKIELDRIETVGGKMLDKNETFRFRCHPDIECFNKCCRNLNLFLYPYDVLRLKKCLDISSDDFLERHTDAVLRPGDRFPDVLLRMAENDERTCPFLGEAGCTVYVDRPDTCRAFPVERGLKYNDDGDPELACFFRPPDFCKGGEESQAWTVETWSRDQEAETYTRMTTRWATIRSRFHESDPFGAEGPNGPKAKMAFMAAYNVDRFREFIFQSSFLKRYKIKDDLKRKLRRSDTELLLTGFEWIEFYLWGLQPTRFRLK